MKKTFFVFAICLTFFSNYAKPIAHPINQLKTGAASVSSSFTPTPGIGWYRIATVGSGTPGSTQGGTVQIYGSYDNRITDIEFQYNIGGYGVGGSIQQTRYSSYNTGFVDQVRISSDGGANTYLDIHISSATTPGVVYLLGDGPYMPSFVSSPTYPATAGSTNVSVLTLGSGFNTTSGSTFAQTGGNVGIGTPSPDAKLSIIEDAGSGATAIKVTNRNSTQTWGIAVDATAVDDGKFMIYNPTTSQQNITIDPAGYVGINTTTPHEALSVNGDIRSKQVKVELANWPDYVFKSTYHLPTLLEVKTYIAKNQHLPDMPSESEVAKEGLNLGEINKLLTKKVEELTLYLIEQSKQLSELKQQVESIAKAQTKN